MLETAKGQVLKDTVGVGWGLGGVGFGGGGCSQCVKGDKCNYGGT